MTSYDRNTFELVGTRIVAPPEIEDKSVVLHVLRGNVREDWRFYHQQNCCEHVAVNWHRTTGNILNDEIVAANDDHPDNPPPNVTSDYEYGDCSHTWTRFTIRTANGTLEFWFLGESNGYYSETVDIEVTSTHPDENNPN